MKPTRVRYGVMAFLCALSFLTYYDRVCISRAQQDVQLDLSLEDGELAVVFGAFSLAYALFEMPSGWLGDRYGGARHADADCSSTVFLYGAYRRRHRISDARRRSVPDRSRRGRRLSKAIDLGLAEANVIEHKNLPLPIKDGWETYLARCEDPEILGGVSPATLKRYTAVRDKHIQFCAASSVGCWSQINKKNTNDYGRWLAKKKNLADRTIVLELNLVCSVVKWLVEENHLPPQCRFLLKLSKPDGTTTFCYTKDQVGRMIAYCSAEPALGWLGNIITGLVTTGLRINELGKLRWTDIDFTAGTICITDERARPRRRQSGLERRLKGKRGRTLPLNLGLRTLLLQLPRHRDGVVFRGKNGGKLIDRRVLEALQKLVITPLAGEFPTPEGEIGFEHGTVHGLRHFFVSAAYHNGASDAQLVEWLGHRDSQLLRVYRHLRPEDGHRQMQKIDFLGPCDESQRPRNTA